MGNENWSVYVNEIDLFNVCTSSPYLNVRCKDKQIRHFYLYKPTKLCYCSFVVDYRFCSSNELAS